MGAAEMNRTGAGSAASMLFPRTGKAAAGLVVLGLAGFLGTLLLGQPQAAWRAYLINFLLFSGIAQGGLAVSAMASTVHVRSSTLPQLAESFAAFFPVSLLLFLGLLPGAGYVFPWLGQEFAGQKDVWLSLPFLLSRDFLAFVLLYGTGLAYLYYTLWLRVGASGKGSGLRATLAALWSRKRPDAERYARRRYVFGVLYLIVFCLALSLLAFDLVMAAEPHWYSTLFGAYAFIKAIYTGIGALIILAAVLHLSRVVDYRLRSWEYIDIGKLLLVFCLLWADFFYCQLVVIWYGNIPEETSYVITRTMFAPWNRIAAGVFAVGFVVPFVVLLNRRVKTLPRVMIALCAVVIAGMWLEHYLLLGPALATDAGAIPLSGGEVLISLGFAGALILAVVGYLNQFPETLRPVDEAGAEDAGQNRKL